MQHNLSFFKMPKMTKDDDPEAHIKAFEHAAIQVGLERLYWASQLQALVIRKAQTTYRALSREEAQAYEKVKAAILHRLKITPKHYWCLFRAKKNHEDR